MHPITQAAFSVLAGQLVGDAYPEASSGAERLAQAAVSAATGDGSREFSAFLLITGNPEIIFLV
jgi:hypothetical protein